MGARGCMGALQQNISGHKLTHICFLNTNLKVYISFFLFCGVGWVGEGRGVVRCSLFTLTRLLFSAPSVSEECQLL